MYVHERGPTGDLRERISHRYDGGFLQGQDIGEVLGEIPQERLLGRSRVSENGGETESAQQVVGGVVHGNLVAHPNVSLHSDNVGWDNRPHDIPLPAAG